jgi:hypothetical protein
MWGNLDNQEVGLEAATLQRKRNSSLVKSSRAVNITGLSVSPKLRVSFEAVGERSCCGEATWRWVVERQEVRMLT